MFAILYLTIKLSFLVNDFIFTSKLHKKSKNKKIYKKNYGDTSGHLSFNCILMHFLFFVSDDSVDS